ncbi:MAG TPA: hypothetical protein VD766_10295 [Solirubrobacterales bacterium]|nr:hypothetical protein [Solirubrobacterales bacterium]
MIGFIAVGGAEAVDGPVPGENTVGSEDIIGGEVRTSDLGDARALNSDFADNSVSGGKVASQTLTGASFAANSLNGADIDEPTLFNDNSLNGADINEATLFNDNSLTSGDLFFAAAGNGEISSGAVSANEVVDGSLDSDELGTASVGASEISSDQVGLGELASVVVERKATTIAGDAVGGQLGSVSVSCPPGSTLINGGYAGAPGLHVIGSGAVERSNGEATEFSVSFDNDQDFFEIDPNRSAEVTAICLDG